MKDKEFAEIAIERIIKSDIGNSDTIFVYFCSYYSDNLDYWVKKYASLGFWERTRVSEAAIRREDKLRVILNLRKIASGDDSVKVKSRIEYEYFGIPVRKGLLAPGVLGSRREVKTNKKALEFLKDARRYYTKRQFKNPPDDVGCPVLTVKVDGRPVGILITPENIHAYTRLRKNVYSYFFITFEVLEAEGFKVPESKEELIGYAGKVRWTIPGGRKGVIFGTSVDDIEHKMMYRLFRA